jgi:hypothetical protein
VSAGMTSFTRVIGLCPSLVTLKCTLTPLPRGALGGSMRTSAMAGAAVPSTPAVIAAASTPARRVMRFRLTSGSSHPGAEWFNVTGLSFPAGPAGQEMMVRCVMCGSTAT